MTLPADLEAEIKQACEKPEDFDPERWRKLIGKCADELSVAGGIVANYAAREIQRRGYLSDRSDLVDLRHTRDYGESLVRIGSGIRR